MLLVVLLFPSRRFPLSVSTLTQLHEGTMERRAGVYINTHAKQQLSAVLRIARRGFAARRALALLNLFFPSALLRQTIHFALHSNVHAGDTNRTASALCCILNGALDSIIFCTHCCEEKNCS
jgi:hypothetical protein